MHEDYESTAVKEREKYVTVSIQELRKIGEEQILLRNQLRERLTSVLSPEHKEPSRSPSESFGVPLADTIREVGASFEDTNSVIRDILGTLEI